MAKLSKRETLINKIMSERYGEDEPQDDSSNYDFLESLPIDELESMATNSDY